MGVSFFKAKLQTYLHKGECMRLAGYIINCYSDIIGSFIVTVHYTAFLSIVFNDYVEFTLASYMLR